MHLRFSNPLKNTNTFKSISTTAEYHSASPGVLKYCHLVCPSASSTDAEGALLRQHVSLWEWHFFRQWERWQLHVEPGVFIKVSCRVQMVASTSISQSQRT